MSKLNFSIIGILVIFVTLITFSSCNKEAELETTTNDDVLERILDFKEKVENPNQQKSGEEISVEDAVWLVEAALNYSYCMTELSDSLLNQFVVDSLSLEINISNGEIFYNDVINSYIEISYEITNVLNDYNANLKKITLADVECDLDNSLIKVYYILGTKEIEEKSTKGKFASFGETDYWYWGWGLGKAPPYSGYEGYDAGLRIQQYANFSIGRPAQYAYLTDIETIKEWAGSDYLWSKTGSGGSPSVEPHLTPTEMTFWLNKLKEVGQLKKPVGKNIINYDVEYEMLLGWDTWGRFHEAELKYGIWHISNPGEL